MHLPGTTINSKNPQHLPPIVVFKRNQAMLSLQSKDFSFVEGKPVNSLHEILDRVKIKANLTQNAAISLYVCLDNIPDKIDEVALLASEIFEVQVEKELTLLTIRHYTGEFLHKLTKDKTIVLQQKTIETIQVLMRNA